jgi:tRNA (guanine-N(7)-)-methyltransferase subunit TRM82
MTSGGSAEMSLPYHCVAGLGQTGIVAASRGTVIFTFGADGALLSSWEHPATQRKAPEPEDVTSEDAAGQVVEVNAGSSPSKKRKVETDAGVQAIAAEPGEEAKQTQGEVHGANQKKRKGGRHTKPSDFRGSEQPYVTLLKTTSSGGHLVAVTGTDKAVWVFEHDGKGQLKGLSQR